LDGSYLYDILFFSQTLFVLKSHVKPAKGSEFCRAGTMCHLQLHVQRVSASSYRSLMYEVLADQTMWAVCGSMAGRFSVCPEYTGFQADTLAYLSSEMSHLCSGRTVLGPDNEPCHEPS
jgi:hypothetical protein